MADGESKVASCDGLAQQFPGSGVRGLDHAGSHDQGRLVERIQDRVGRLF
jgi:hypothetical protein